MLNDDQYIGVFEAEDNQSAEGLSLEGKWVVLNGKAYFLQENKQPQPEDKTSKDDGLLALQTLCHAATYSLSRRSREAIETLVHVVPQVPPNCGQ